MIARSDISLIPVSVAIGAWVLVVFLMTVVGYSDADLAIAMFSLPAIFTLLFGQALCRAHGARAISYALPFIVLPIIIGLLGQQLRIFMEAVAISASQDFYRKCAPSAVHISDREDIGICAVSDDGLSGIVYDSSDQIALPQDRRSSNWRYVTYDLGKFMPFNIYRFTARHIVGHFYDVRFDEKEMSAL